MSNIIGSIGLGTMGGSYASHLLKNGYEVYGLDPNHKSSNEFILKGGKILFNINDLITKSDVIILSFARQNIYVGEFGNGIKFKLLANLLVTVHNTVTAEALLLGQKVGLNENKIYEVLNAGAASSVMLDKRMPLMIKKNYEPATASMTIFLKDIEVIRQFIKSNNVISPTFEAAAKVYDDAKLNLPMTYDTAAVFEQLKLNNK